MGKELSKLLQLPFIDLDDIIEEQEGMKISEIFSSKGEAYFRSAESAVLRKQSETEEFVMATGGGTPCFHENMNFLNKKGTSIFLDTPIHEIVRRLDNDQRKSRPLLAGVSDDQLIHKLEEMLQNRRAFYQQAHFTVREPKATAHDVLQLISAKK